jgi:hypothetical protein
MFKSITKQNLKIFGLMESSKFEFTKLEQFFDNWKSIVREPAHCSMRPGLCFLTGPKPHRLGLARPTWPFPTARAPGVVPTTRRSADRATYRSDARHLPSGLHAPRMQPPLPVQRL